MPFQRKNFTKKSEIARQAQKRCREPNSLGHTQQNALQKMTHRKTMMFQRRNFKKSEIARQAQTRCREPNSPGQTLSKIWRSIASCSERIFTGHRILSPNLNTRTPLPTGKLPRRKTVVLHVKKRKGSQVQQRAPRIAKAKQLCQRQEQTHTSHRKKTWAQGRSGFWRHSHMPSLNPPVGICRGIISRINRGYRTACEMNSNLLGEYSPQKAGGKTNW